MSTVWQDCRYAVRLLLRARARATLAILTIGVAIGANTTIFTVVHATLLRALPYPQPDRIMQVAHAESDGSIDSSVSVPKYLFWREHATAFAALAAYQDLGGSGVNLTGAGEPPERVGATRVSSSFFDVLATQPVIGRTFLSDEHVPGRGRRAILSHGLWLRRFGGMPAIVGQTISVNDEPYDVVGVMPAGFGFPQWAELWLPLEIDPASDVRHGFLDVIGRLRPGGDLASARSEMRVLQARYAEAHPADVLTGVTFHVRPLRDALYGDLRPALLTLLAAVGAVLLIACVNVANIQLARSTERVGELGIRIALGATSRRIVRQLLVESLVLALAGGLVGVWLAAFLLPLVMVFAPQSVQSIPHIAVDGPGILFTLALSLLTALLFGLLPARQAARGGVVAIVPTRGVMASATHPRLRRAMIAVEVAMAIMLAVSASLLTRTFVSLVTTDPGFEPRGLLTMQLHFSGVRYEAPGAVEATARRVIDDARSTGTIAHAAIATSLPFGTGTGMSFTIEGRASDPAAGAGRFRYVGATPEFFVTMGIDVRRGRLFHDADRGSARLVAVINETAARRYWPDGDAIGQHITIGQPVNPEVADPSPREIIGIVADVREWGVGEAAPPIVYVPLAQVPAPLAALFSRLLPLSFVVRAPLAAADTASAAAAIVRRVDPLLPITATRTGEQLLTQSLQEQRFNALLMGMLAVVAVVLALTGIYGVMACLVAQRTREIGVRIALGAMRRDVARMLLAQALRPAAAGAAVGIAAALAAARVFATLLHEISPADPFALALGVTAVLMLVALAAYLPARRAARLDPLASIRANP